MKFHTKTWTTMKREQIVDEICESFTFLKLWVPESALWFSIVVFSWIPYKETGNWKIKNLQYFPKTLILQNTDKKTKKSTISIETSARKFWRENKFWHKIYKLTYFIQKWFNKMGTFQYWLSGFFGDLLKNEYVKNK